MGLPVPWDAGSRWQWHLAGWEGEARGTAPSPGERPMIRRACRKCHPNNCLQTSHGPLSGPERLTHRTDHRYRVNRRKDKLRGVGVGTGSGCGESRPRFLVFRKGHGVVLCCGWVRRRWLPGVHRGWRLQFQTAGRCCRSSTGGYPRPIWGASAGGWKSRQSAGCAQQMAAFPAAFPFTSLLRPGRDGVREGREIVDGSGYMQCTLAGVHS